MMMKKLYKTLLLLIAFAVILKAQETPILLSPLDGERHIKTTKLSLQWFSIEGVETYRVQLSAGPDFFPQNILMDVIRTSPSVVTPVLENLTTYFWRVKIDSADSPWSPVWRFTTTGFPTVVNLLLPTDGKNNIDTDVIIFNWSEDSVNASYNLQISTDPDFPDTIRNVTVNEETTELTNLNFGRLHYWRVKAFNIDGVAGEWSDVFSFKTRLAKPAMIAPTNFANNQDTSVIFRWARVQTASIYDFQLSFNEEFAQDSILFDSSVTTDRIRIEELENDRIYYWRLKSRNAFADTSKWSEPFAFKTRLEKPSLTNPLDKSRNNELSVMLEWTPGDDLDFYHLQVAEDSLFRQLFSNSFVESNSATILNLEYNKFYYWRISIQNTDGDSSSWADFSWFKTKLDTPIPTFPENNVTRFSPEVTFEWAPVDSAEFYSFHFAESDTFLDTVLFKQTKDTLITLDSLEINHKFYWRVQAANPRSDTSEWSNTFVYNTSPIALSSLVIDTTINFSLNRIDTISSIVVFNNSNIRVALASISAVPDTIFSVSESGLNLMPNDSTKLYIIADTSRVDTGRIDGQLNFVRSFDEFVDTMEVPLSLTALKSIGLFSQDTLNFDTTFSASPRTEVIRLSNRLGNIPLIVNYLYVEGDSYESFILNTEVEKIGAGDSINVSITFDPMISDTSIVYLVAETNSYPEELLRLPIIGVGAGGEISNQTKERFEELKEEKFVTLFSNDGKIIIENSGDFPLELNFRFAENYFDFTYDKPLPMKLQPGDTAGITLSYLTPNFDSLNTDTLIITHNGIGKSPMKIKLDGVFDSLAAVNSINGILSIDGENIGLLSSGIQIPAGTPVQARLSSDLFKNESNLDFQISYFLGGPGDKLTALETNDNRLIIPFNNVGERGLLFKGELFTQGFAGQPIDSITVFKFIDVQVEINNYRTKDVNVPLSVANANIEKANVNWVLFGYPFEQVINDSAFSDFGDPAKMQDGEWVVYDYNSSLGSFNLLADNPITAGKAYFIAQAVNEDANLAYRYQNTIVTRKLSDNKIEIPGNGWRTISSPYTFDVEVDTPAVLYRFDTFAKSYKLTNIMRPGEGYFVPPEVTELNLINYGEYFPAVFPKVISGSEWLIDLAITNNVKTEQLLIAGSKLANNLYKVNTSNGYRKAPKIDDYFEAYLVDDNEQKLAALVEQPFGEFGIDLILESGRNESVQFRIANELNLPEGYSFAIADQFGNSLSLRQDVILGKDYPSHFKFVYGTKKYISETLNNIKSSLVTDFELHQNYPNPFNPSTTITYSLPSKRHVVIRVYDILGNEVVELVNEVKSPGLHSATFEAGNLATGMYIVSLTAGNYSKAIKVLLLK